MWQGGVRKTNNTVPAATTSFTTPAITKEGDYQYKIYAYSKETRGLLESPVVVNVKVVGGKFEINVAE